MWRELIARLEPAATFHPPATPRQLADLADALGMTLPGDLADLLRETNGVEYASGIGLVWPAEDIAWRNRELRRTRDERLYAPFDDLLFFADAGDGTHFAFGLAGAMIASADVLWWDPIGDDRDHRIASSLRQYVEWALAGA